MKIKLYTLLILVLATASIGAPSNHEAEEKKAIDLWQRAQKIPEGQNPKADLARQVISGSLKVEQILPEGILASGFYGVPGYFKPKDAFVFGAQRTYNFQEDILVVGYQSDVTDGDSFNTILFPCGVYKHGSRTLKCYATTLEQAWDVLHPNDNVNAEIERLEIEKKRIETRLIELRKQRAEKEAK